MRKNNKTGIQINGSLRSAGITFYTKKGQTITRTSTSIQPERRTYGQFEVRQKRTHCNLLWANLKRPCGRFFTVGATPYGAFCSLAAKLPPVYQTRMEYTNGSVFLMPGIPVSCGTLPDIRLSLGEVEGSPALLTDMVPGGLGHDRLTLVTLRQVVLDNVPRMGVEVRNVAYDEFAVVEGQLVLTGDDYGDDMSGWALVRRRGTRCSTQRVVTACRLYLPYLTDEALRRAAESFGGLTYDRFK